MITVLLKQADSSRQQKIPLEISRQRRNSSAISWQFKTRKSDIFPFVFIYSLGLHLITCFIHNHRAYIIMSYLHLMAVYMYQFIRFHYQESKSLMVCTQFPLMTIISIRDHPPSNTNHNFVLANNTDWPKAKDTHTILMGPCL